MLYKIYKKPIENKNESSNKYSISNAKTHSVANCCISNTFLNILIFLNISESF